MRPKNTGLTENEFHVMKVLWQEAPLKVAEILPRLSRTPKPAYTSLLTLVQAMERKGYIHHVKVGKAFYYFPKLAKQSFMSHEIQRMTKRLFNGNPLSLAVNLIQDEHLSPQDVEELKRILEERY